MASCLLQRVCRLSRHLPLQKLFTLIDPTTVGKELVQEILKAVREISREIGKLAEGFLKSLLWSVRQVVVFDTKVGCNMDLYYKFCE